MNRARRAYFIATKPEGADAKTPDQKGSGIYHRLGKEYAVLKKNGETLAVYRIRNDGKLKRLKRIPTDLVKS